MEPSVKCPDCGTIFPVEGHRTMPPVYKLGRPITGNKPDPSNPTPTPTDPNEPPRIGLVTVGSGYDASTDTFTLGFDPAADPSAVRPTQVAIYVTTEPPSDPADPAAPKPDTPEFWQNSGFPSISAGIPESGDPGTISLQVAGIPIGPVYAMPVLEYAS